MAKLDINEDARIALPPNQTYVPMRINNKQSIMGMDSDVFGIIMLSLVAGHLAKELLLICGIGIIVAALYAKIKEEFPKGRLLHILWWFGIVNYQSKRSYPEAFNREYYR